MKWKRLQHSYISILHFLDWTLCRAAKIKGVLITMKDYYRFGGWLFAVGFAGSAQASLVGAVQQYPDITLNSTYLIYDHDALKTYNNGACNSDTSANACIGLLTVVSYGSTLNSGPVPAPSATQLYAGGGGSDQIPDKMMTIAITSSGPSSTLGTWASSTNPNANKVSITYGTTPADVDKFSWLGDVKNFGWLADNTSTSTYYELGTQFDGFWNFTADTYVNMPPSMSQFVNGVLTAAMNAPDPDYLGGYKISNSAGFTQDGNPSNTASSNKVSLANALKRDWVFGPGANTSSVQALLSAGGFLTGLKTNHCSSNTSTNCVKYLNSTVQVDVFVPVPPAFWLWGGALGTVVPFVRRHMILNSRSNS